MTSITAKEKAAFNDQMNAIRRGNSPSFFSAKIMT